MKYNSIGQQLIAKAQELDPNYKPDKFNDMSEAIDVILNNSGVDRLWYDNRYHYREVPLVSDILGGKIDAKPYYLYSVEVRTNNHYKDIYFRNLEMCIMSSEKSNRMALHLDTSDKSYIDTSTDEIRIRSDKYKDYYCINDKGVETIESGINSDE